MSRQLGLAWILSAQKAHHQRTGRYGTLDELVDSGDLPLTGPRTADGFDRLSAGHFPIGTLRIGPAAAVS